jgi:hypothetical protein
VLNLPLFVDVSVWCVGTLTCMCASHSHADTHDPPNTGPDAIPSLLALADVENHVFHSMHATSPTISSADVASEHVPPWDSTYSSGSSMPALATPSSAAEAHTRLQKGIQTLNELPALGEPQNLHEA